MGDLMIEEKYSFSRLEAFHNCKRLFYYTYVQNDRSGDNIYSFLGTVVHELTQCLIQEQETNESAVEKFLAAVNDAEMLDLPWISEKVRDNYVECITHFLENYLPTSNNTIRIEDYFEIDIKGTIVRGYIDLWYRIGNNIYIVDFKTSTKYNKKDLPKKARQLVLYAMALKEKYPEYNIILQFNMLKYAIKNGKLIERNNLDLFDEYTDGILDIKCTLESMNEVSEYITETLKEINKINKDDLVYWSMDKNPNKDFFCVNLCGHRSKCLEKLGVKNE
jgi:hypothetical protein